MTFRSTLGHGGGNLLAAVALLFTSGILAGCSNPDVAEDESVVAAPPKIAFEGKIDPAYVGTWITANKTSTLVLTAEGKADMTNVAVGRGTTKAKGQWKISGTDLLFKVEDPNSYVSRYAAELKKDSLRLKQKASKLDVEYRRSK
jgi:hypothetical protein